MVALVPTVGTFLIFGLFYAVTLHVAARWVVGETPLRQALLVGPLPAAAVIALWLADLPGTAVLATALVVDFSAITAIYDEKLPRTVLLTVTHLVVTLALGAALWNLWVAVSG